MTKRVDDAVDHFLSKRFSSGGRSSVHGLSGEPLALRRTLELLAFIAKHSRAPKRTAPSEASLARFLHSLRQSYKGHGTRVPYPGVLSLLELSGFSHILDTGG